VSHIFEKGGRYERSLLVNFYYASYVMCDAQIKIPHVIAVLMDYDLQWDPLTE